VPEAVDVPVADVGGQARPASPEAGGEPVAMDAYDYGLPDHAIAQRPVEPRSSARLLIGPGVAGNAHLRHATVASLPSLLRPGDVVVVNVTRVMAARLELRRATGGAAEVLLLEPAQNADHWSALVRPGRRLVAGTVLFDRPDGAPVVEIVGAASAEPAGRVEPLGDGRRLVRLLDRTVIARCGRVPLPPYIHEPLVDSGRYQTVYAEERATGDSSVAAPTAGLHFTPELLAECEAAGARVVSLDLVIGLDTFRPITAATPAEHRMHSERYAIPAETMEACRAANRVVAVGTTVVRALESAAATGELSGRTDLFVRGRYPFRVVDLLLTNFHLPRSTLLLLVESFCGPEWRSLYASALAEGYRFLSFGDAMIVRRHESEESRRPAPDGAAPDAPA
jgi:S-adenosylmethionine:tRNA ribosyltransferase-isomerase